MSATRKGKKQAEEQDFEAFVRESLNTMCKDVEEIKGGQARMQGDINLLKSQVSSNEKELKSIRNFEKLNGDMHEANVKIDGLEGDVNKYSKLADSLKERIMALERYPREYNLRFHNIRETPREGCINKLQTIFSNDFNIKPEIKNARRIGAFRDDGSPRPLIAKFIYRPERFQIFRKRRDLQNMVWLSVDLIYEDPQKKNLYKNVMKEAFNHGKKPRFHARLPLHRWSGVQRLKCNVSNYLVFINLYYESCKRLAKISVMIDNIICVHI